MKQAMMTVAVAAVLSLGLGGISAEAGPRKPGKQVSGVINLNQATAQQLDMLPGVGAKAAARIIEHRKKTPFSRPEEIVQVKGFGKKKYDRLKPHLAVSGPTNLRQLVPAAATEAPTEQGRASPPAKR